MEPKVVEWMEDVRYNRLKKERGPRIYRRLRVLSVAVAAILPRRRGEPSLCDIALGIPELKPILEEPSQEGVTVADFDFLKTALPAFAVKWREDVQAHLRSVAMEKIKAAGVELAPSVDPLSSAIGSVFICTSCTDSHVIRRDYLTEFTYPDLLSHVCIRQALPYTGNYFADAVAEHLRHLPHWEPAKFQSIGVDMMKGLLEKCGLEPKTATLADLDALRFRCLKHHDDWTLRVRNWQSLVRLFRQSSMYPTLNCFGRSFTTGGPASTRLRSRNATLRATWSFRRTSVQPQSCSKRAQWRSAPRSGRHRVGGYVCTAPRCSRRT